jgi:hypothetical protein
MEFALEFPDEDAFESVDPGGELPLHVVGRIHQPMNNGDIVLIVVNDTVAATAEIFTNGDRDQRFTAILDRVTLRAGSNRIALYAL